ncbi:MAG: primosomal protein N' [Candidatus Neomarinimicrobiota bacterium]
MSADTKFVDVVFPATLRRSFTYRVPYDYADPLMPGQRVVAPLKSSSAVGFIVRVNPEPPKNIELREIQEIIDMQPIFPAELLIFLQKLADYYLTPFGKVLSAAIPPEFRFVKSRKLVSVRPAQDEPSGYADIFAAVAIKGEMPFNRLKSKFDTVYLQKGLMFLKKEDFITERPEFKPLRFRGRVEHTIRLVPENDGDAPTAKRKAPRQEEILKTLRAAGGILSDADSQSFSPAVVAALKQKGLITVEATDRTLSDLWREFGERRKVVTFNDDQNLVNDKIGASLREAVFAPYLLEGVTGSGKTEIYLQAIRDTLSLGRTALVLVPEITLTTHLAARFRGEFPDQIAIWHSTLTPAQRSVIWGAVLRGEFPVVIGARSAVLLPLPNLGLIIVDEEQDNSYKQKSPEPRYHARDAALLRGVESKATVVLGSATPSLESQYNAVIGKLTKLTLPRRYSKAPTAIIQVVDMKTEIKETGDVQNPISRLLAEKIRAKVNAGQQVLLLQNRRGYSPVLLCPDCGWVPECRNCDISLTFHKKSGTLQCHYCNLHETPPAICPRCSGTNFLYPGVGTQKVEFYLKASYPDYRFERLDMDSSRIKDRTSQILQQFEDNQIQVLLGTQMIAKGLDFPNVTLVGVINADLGLYMPDFRARERVFQLLYQVSGRAGRGDVQGEIIIQTYNPQDFTIRCALQQNLVGFSNFELNERNPLNYPPFSRLAMIQISDLNNQRANQVAGAAADFLNSRRGKIDLLGPAAAPLARLVNRYRFQIVLKSRRDHDPHGSNLHRLLNTFLNSREYQTLSRQARIAIDIDPLDLL